MEEIKNICENKICKKWLPALILGVAIFGGLWVHGYYMAGRNANNTISVTGSAKQSVAADLAKWSASFTRHAGKDNLKETLSLANSDTVKIKKFITDLGISESSITFLPLQSSTVYSTAQNDYSQSAANIVGYNISMSVRVEDKDISNIPIVLLAENSSDDCVNKSIECGAAGCISRLDQEPKEIVNQIQKYLH